MDGHWAWDVDRCVDCWGQGLFLVKLEGRLVALTQEMSPQVYIFSVTSLFSLPSPFPVSQYIPDTPTQILPQNREGRALFPSQHAGSKWPLAHSYLNLNMGKEKRAEREVAKLAMFTQRGFALIQACEPDRAQNKRKQMCPSRQRIYCY